MVEDAEEVREREEKRLEENFAVSPCTHSVLL